MLRSYICFVTPLLFLSETSVAHLGGSGTSTSHPVYCPVNSITNFSCSSPSSTLCLIVLGAEQAEWVQFESVLATGRQLIICQLLVSEYLCFYHREKNQRKKVGCYFWPIIFFVVLFSRPVKGLLLYSARLQRISLRKKALPRSETTFFFPFALPLYFLMGLADHPTGVVGSSKADNYAYQNTYSE